MSDTWAQRPALTDRYVLAASFAILFLEVGAASSSASWSSRWRTTSAGPAEPYRRPASSSMAVYAVATIVTGRLYDRYGPKWVIVVSTILFSAGYALMATMDSLVATPVLRGRGRSWIGRYHRSALRHTDRPLVRETEGTGDQPGVRRRLLGTVLPGACVLRYGTQLGLARHEPLDSRPCAGPQPSPRLRDLTGRSPHARSRAIRGRSGRERRAVSPAPPCARGGANPRCSSRGSHTLRGHADPLPVAIRAGHVRVAARTSCHYPLGGDGHRLWRLPRGGSQHAGLALASSLGGVPCRPRRRRDREQAPHRGYLCLPDSFCSDFFSGLKGTTSSRCLRSASACDCWSPRRSLRRS